MAWSGFARVVTNPTALLYFRGEFLHEELRRQRVTQSELRAAVRRQPGGSLSEVDAVVLESNGVFSVIESVEPGTRPEDVDDDDLEDRADRAMARGLSRG